MWCDRFATEADPKASTRSTLLKPSGGMYEVAADPLWPDPYDVSTKRKRKLVEGVAAARSTELTQNGTMENLAVPRWDQMLLCFPFDGA